MQEAKHHPTTTKLPSQSQSSSQSPSPSAPAANPLQYHHGYGTFPQPFQPSTPHVVGAAAYHDCHASPIGFGGQGFVAFPCAVQQQVFVEGVPVREPPLPFCGVGVGWFLLAHTAFGVLGYTSNLFGALVCLRLREYCCLPTPHGIVGVILCGITSLVLFLLGFFLAAIPWYAGAFLLFFVALDHREKPGLIACTVAGIFALVPFILNGIRLHPFW